MKTVETVSFRKKAPQKKETIDTSLSEIMNLDLLRQMRDEKMVNVSGHPDDPSLKILNYSSMAQVKGRWNDVTKQSRGLIIRSDNDDFSDAVIVERPWRKFFTLQQMTGTDGNTAWAMGDEENDSGNSMRDSIESLDFDAPAEVTDKRDGSMGILYEAPDGELALSTRGSFASDQAHHYTTMLRENRELLDAAHKLKANNPNTTFIFELTGPDNQIVVSYSKDEIAIIGAVDKDTGLYRSTSEFQNDWGGLPKAETMPAQNLHEALSLPDRKNREGVVVRITSDDPDKQMMVKIKQEDYLKLHHVMTSMTPKKVFEITRDGEFDNTLNTIKTASFFTDDHCEKFVKFNNNLHKVFTERKNAALKDFESIREISERKDFAAAAKKTSNPKLMFALYDRKNIDTIIWRDMEKNIPQEF